MQLRVTFKLSETATDTVDAGRLVQILQQPSGVADIHTLKRLDIRTGEEQRIGAWGRDDMTNMEINMFREAIDHRPVRTSRRVQLYADRRTAGNTVPVRRGLNLRRNPLFRN